MSPRRLIAADQVRGPDGLMRCHQPARFQAGREVRSRHMNAAEGLAAVGRMIAACRHGDRAATDYEIAW